VAKGHNYNLRFVVAYALWAMAANFFVIGYGTSGCGYGGYAAKTDNNKIKPQNNRSLLWPTATEAFLLF
jgi:hypothetical protein